MDIDDYTFGANPSWDSMKKALVLGGLGFWRLFRKADGEILFDPDETLLVILGIQRVDIPQSFDIFLAKYFQPKYAKKIATIMQECFAGTRNTFDMECPIRAENNTKSMRLRVFGNVEPADSNGHIRVISGYTQNIQVQHEAKANLKIALQENKTVTERTRTMLDNMPVICDFWGAKPKQKNAQDQETELIVIDVNKAALDLFGVPDKETYFKIFDTLSPEIQPNGRLSSEMGAEMLDTVIRDGSVTFEWMHQKIDGTPIPSEITLTKVPFDNQFTIISYMHDLTFIKAAQAERDIALEANKEANERTRIMLDTLPMVCEFWETGVLGSATSNRMGPIDALQGDSLYMTDVNKASLILFELPDKQAYFDSFRMFSLPVQPDGRSTEEVLFELTNRVIREGRIQFEWMHYRLDGTPIPCEISLIAEPYGDKFIILAYKRDLRALKAAQAELNVAIEEKRIVNERIRTMLDTLPVVCNFWDTNPRDTITLEPKLTLPCLNGKSAYLVDVNNAALRLFDLPEKKSYIRDFVKLSPEIQPDGTPSAEGIVRLMDTAFSEGKPLVFEWMHQKLDGTPVPCEITLIRTMSGEDATLVGYMRDLRDLKAAQSAMMIERLLLKEIMNSTPICFTITVNDIIKFITPFAKEFIGCDIGDTISKIYTSERAYQILKAKQAQNTIITWHAIQVKRPDGGINSMLLTSLETDYYGEVGVMNWFVDITEMRQKNRELQQARKMAEESTRAKSNFLANMSHEIRTPMNAILGLLHLLMQGSLNTTQREYLSKTEGAAKALLRIINDILDFSKIEAGKLEMENEDFSLDDVLQSVTDLASAGIYEKGLEYVVYIEPGTPMGLIGDQVRLVQILSNLVSNAAKFTAEGQIVVKIETVVKNTTNVTLRCLVQDTGIGLTKQQVGTLFSAFTQADTSTTRRYGGTGLGLVISKRLVEIMGGTIWVESEYGQGSTFGFTVKFGVQKDAPTHELGYRTDFRGFSALVIDDNQVALEYLTIFLQNAGLEVAKVMSGQEALTLLADKNARDEHFDIIFTDWKMPGMDGIETTKQINALLSPSKLPVIIMVTAYNREEVLALITEVGIERVMSKPVLPSSILNVLNDTFGSKFLAVEAENPERISQEQAMVKDFVGAHILLAEDNTVNQLVASCILKNAGLLVDIANDGKEAVAMAKTGKYDLILMDIQMPEMDGLEATRAIRSIKKFKDLPILAMTANAMSGDKEMSLDAGMNGHISKPIDLYEMFSAMEKCLRKTQANNKNNT